MERLTERITDKNTKEVLAYRTKYHKDLEAVQKLGQLEDLEEQGKLLKLLCKVGDKIYRIDTDEKIENREIEIYDIDNIVILSDGAILLKYDAYDGVICELENIITDKPYLDFYRCFLNKEQAEAALKKMNEREEKEENGQT